MGRGKEEIGGGTRIDERTQDESMRGRRQDEKSRRQEGVKSKEMRQEERSKRRLGEVG